MTKELFVIFIGSGLGGICRYILGRSINSFVPMRFPFGTFTVNIIACFALGYIIGFADSKHALSPLSKLFLSVGFCGGFSTFSTFSNESLLLFQQENYFLFALYSFGSILLGISATFCGVYFASKI